MKYNEKTLMIDKTVLHNFSKGYARVLFLHGLLKRYNNILSQDDYIKILGLIKIMGQELQGIAFWNSENYETLKYYTFNETKNLEANYYARGMDVWQKIEEKRRVSENFREKGSKD